LDTVFQQRSVPFEVILVDDNSTDGTPDAVAQRHPQTRIIRENVNRGPAVCRNRGVQSARGEVVVGLDSDVTLPDPDTFPKLLAVLDAHPAVAGLAFHLLRPDGRSEDVDRWWHPLPIADFADRPFYTDYFSGTAYAFRKPAFSQAGGFPEVFFMHYEEVQLAYRIWDNGGTILYCPNLIALHHENRVSRRTEARQFYKPRNQILLAIACYPVWRAILFLVPRLGYALLRSLSPRRFRIFARALVSAARLAPRCWPARQPLRSATWRRLKGLRRVDPRAEAIIL
jgi:GT2 family glycosyltransferase